MTGADIPGTPYGLATITSTGSHVRNILRHPLATGRFAAGFGAGRFLARGRRVPGFFMYSKANLYPFQYHGEQAAQPGKQGHPDPGKGPARPQEARH